MIQSARQEAQEILARAGILDEPIKGACGETEEPPVEAEIDRIAEEELDDGWSRPSWHDAAREYHRQRGNRSSEVIYTAEELAHLCRLLDDNLSLDRAYSDLHAARLKASAAPPTVEALMFSLRERGAQALAEPGVRQRLSKLDDRQLLEVAARLQRLRPEIAPAWSADEVEALMQLRETLR